MKMEGVACIFRVSYRCWRGIHGRSLNQQRNNIYNLQIRFLSIYICLRYSPNPSICRMAFYSKTRRLDIADSPREGNAGIIIQLSFLACAPRNSWARIMRATCTPIKHLTVSLPWFSAIKIEALRSGVECELYSLEADDMLHSQNFLVLQLKFKNTMIWSRGEFVFASSLGLSNLSPISYFGTPDVSYGR
jgi:hypothetical protein